MTLEEYYKKRTYLQNKHKKELKELAKKYALSNNPVQIGDMFTDHIGTIKVEKIGIYNLCPQPSCIYYGPCYTKYGKPFKSGEKRDAFQVNAQKED